MEESILKDFYIVHRSIVRMYESGEISYTEKVVFEWLNYIADKYGYAHVKSYKWFAERLPLDIKGNTVGVVMRSLRNHRFIDYSDRQGSRRGFKVTIGFWPTGNGKYRNLPPISGAIYENKAVTDSIVESQLNTHVPIENHKLPILMNSGRTAEKMSSIRSLITSYNNDIEKKKEKENTSLQLGKENFDIDAYIPKTAEEQRCLEIAYAIGEESAGFIIGIYRKHGLLPIERAYEEYLTKDLTKLNNPKALFNSLVMNSVNLY